MYMIINPPSHINTHIPRGTGRGGAAAAIFDSSLLINPMPKVETVTTFKNRLKTLLFHSAYS